LQVKAANQRRKSLGNDLSLQSPSFGREQAEKAVTGDSIAQPKFSPEIHFGGDANQVERPQAEGGCRAVGAVGANDNKRVSEPSFFGYSPLFCKREIAATHPSEDDEGDINLSTWKGPISRHH
jgi:hypothetical protein